MVVVAARTQKPMDELVRALDGNLLRALAEPTRLEILKFLLINGRSDINTIAEQLVQDRSVVSRHIKLMRDVGMVGITKEGRHRFVVLEAEDIVGRLRRIVDTVEAAIHSCCPPNPPKGRK